MMNMDQFCTKQPLCWFVFLIVLAHWNNSEKKICFNPSILYPLMSFTIRFTSLFQPLPPHVLHNQVYQFIPTFTPSCPSQSGLPVYSFIKKVQVKWCQSTFFHPTTSHFCPLPSGLPLSSFIKKAQVIINLP